MSSHNIDVLSDIAIPELIERLSGALEDFIDDISSILLDIDLKNYNYVYILNIDKYTNKNSNDVFQILNIQKIVLIMIILKHIINIF